MEKTAEYLKKAITGESNAAIMYSKFAEVASNDGYSNIAYLFTALEQAERIHIKNHKQALGDHNYKPEEGTIDIGTTQENLRTAFAGESYEYKKMYPSFIRAIKSETKTEYGKVGRLSMQWAAMVEKVHADTLKKALKNIKSGKDFNITNIYMCRVCGNLLIGNEEPDSVCPVCGHDHMFYKLVIRKNEEA